MTIIFKYLIILVCFLISFPWNSHDNIIAMDLHEHEKKIYESQEIEEYLKAQEELALLKNNLLRQGKKAPLYELTTKKGRKVYILGSFHSRHPELFLSENNFHFIKSLQHHAVLFIEHHTPYIKVMEKIFSNKETEDLWDIRFSENMLKITINKKQEDIQINNAKQWDDWIQAWEKEKEKSFSLPENIRVQLEYPHLPKINSIQKIDLIEGLLFFYEYSLDKGIEFTLGFESTLLNWFWKGDPRELEDPQKCLGFFKDNFIEALSFFESGLDKIAKIQQYQEQAKQITWEEIKLDYIKDMKDYYDPGTEKQDEATIARNLMWCVTLAGYLEEANDQSPILIVCGAAHLRGEGNFIQLLLTETDLFEKEVNWLGNSYSGGAHF